MAVTVKDVLAWANPTVPKLEPHDLRQMIGASDVVLIDVRDVPEPQQSGSAGVSQRL